MPSQQNFFCAWPKTKYAGYFPGELIRVLGEKVPESCDGLFWEFGVLAGIPKAAVPGAFFWLPGPVNFETNRRPLPDGTKKSTDPIESGQEGGRTSTNTSRALSPPCQFFCVDRWAPDSTRN